MAAVTFKILRDDISPRLTRMATTAKRPVIVFRAMGTTFMSLTMGNFKQGDYRPRDWPAKKDGTPATLQKSGTLSRSFHLTVDDKSATLANPMVYAAIHQFGAEGHVAGVVVGKIKTKYANSRYLGSLQNVMSGAKGIPPRPYFPVEGGKLTPKAEEEIAAAGQRALERELGK